MKKHSSRRDFLAAGLALPAAAVARNTRPAPAGPALPAPQQPKAGMQYRTLGKTGLKVTTMGFGCMITSDPSVVEKAADLGVTYFDTARVYMQGNNERMVGAALKPYRKNLVLSSKSSAENKAEALENLEATLRELGTDYIDIWYLHGKSKASQITDEWLEAQQQAKKAGKIRFSGLSTHGGHAEIIPAVIARHPPIDVLLTSYNFSMDPSMQGLVESAAQAGLGVVAMKVMAGGFRRVKESDPLYGKLKREGAMLAALKWVIKNPNVHTTVPSITDMDQLDENMKSMASPFGEKDEKVLAAQLDYIRPLYCRMCGSCDGVCPKGLPVADVIRHLSYVEGYGDYRLARESFMELTAEAREIRCSACASCAVRCPNGVRVAERLIRAQELLA